MPYERDTGTGLRPQLSRVSERGFNQLSHLHGLVQTISNQDAEIRYREEAADNRIQEQDRISEDVTPDSHSIQAPRETKTVISWRENDPGNPHNFSSKRKVYILFTTMMLVMNSTLGSSLPSMAIPAITEEWGVTAQRQMVLPMSCYLVGYVLGPMFWGPVSEHMGRRWPLLATFLMFTIWTLACAVAPNWPSLLIFRFLVGAFASAPIAITAGVLADIYGDPVTRGRSMAYFMACTVWGPLLAPIISGYTATTIGWRWTFWIALLFAAGTAAFAAFLPETYAPVLLARRAAALRRADPVAHAHTWAASELEPRDLRQLAGVVLTRPLRMLLTELIVSATCLYLSLVYAIFYMSFQAFPLIFQGVYGLAPGVTGLCYLPIGAGAIVALPIFFAYDGILARARHRGAAWAAREEARRVPLAFLAGPLFVVSLFWLGWSARAAVPFWVPMLAGIPFGAGYQLIFMALLNYLTDAYEIFAASANAAASSCRSVFAVVLPLASGPLFANLGIAGGCSLLGGLSALMCAIPFLFFWKGERLRAGSGFCIALLERKREMERNAEEERQRRAREEGVTEASEKKEEAV